jgi:hypothetical protein
MFEPITKCALKAIQSLRPCLHCQMMKNTARSRVLQLRLAVRDVKPEIWRTVLVSSDTTLAGLHRVLQALMGWQNHHLYAFVIDGKRYFPRFEDDVDQSRGSVIGTKLSSLFKKAEKVFTYEYDFGDCWEIELRNEAERDMIGHKVAAECIDGGRHGPVEDSGGSRGYMEKIRIYGNPQHKAYQQIRNWIGPNFDPESFNLAEANKLLKAFA